MKKMMLLLMVNLMVSTVFAEGKQTTLSTKEIQSMLGINAWSFDLDKSKRYTVKVGYRDNSKQFHSLREIDQIQGESVKVATKTSGTTVSKISIIANRRTVTCSSEANLINIPEKKCNVISPSVDPKCENGTYTLIEFRAIEEAFLYTLEVKITEK